MGKFDRFKGIKTSQEPEKEIERNISNPNVIIEKKLSLSTRQKKSKLIGTGLTEQEKKVSRYYNQLCILYDLKDKNAGDILTLLSTFISDGQELVIQHHQKDFISKKLGLSIQRIEQIIYILKKTHLISHTGERSIYTACSYVLPKYEWHKLNKVIMDYDLKTVSFFEDK